MQSDRFLLDSLLAPAREHPLRSSGRFRHFSLLALLVLAGAGCARVAPYERETLARRDMGLGGHGDLTAGEEHAQSYREGSSGGGAAKGGGCGCN